MYIIDTPKERGLSGCSPNPTKLKKQVLLVLHDIRFILSQPLKLADDEYIGIFINIKTYEYVGIFFFSFNFPRHLIKCRLGAFDMIFIT
jgi:hypothetical protein